VVNTRTLTVAGTDNQITSSAGAQDLSANRTWTLSLPNHVIFPANFQATNSTTTNATTTGAFYVTGPFASTTNFYANGLVSCSSNNVLTWTGGAFGCEADDVGTSAYEVATTSTIAQSQLSYFTQTSGRTTLGGVATTSLTLTSFPANFSGTLGALVGGANSTWTWWGLATTSAITQSHLLYSSGANGVTSVATSTRTYSGPFSTSGTLGAQVGGTNSVITWTGLATTSQPASSNLLVSNGGAGVYAVATSSRTFSGPFTSSGTLGAQVGGTNSVITWTGLATTTQPASSNLLVSNGGAGVYPVATTSLTLTSFPATMTGTLGALVGGSASTWTYWGVATSAAIANTEVIYGTAVNTVDSEAAFAYNAASNRLTLTYASTTAISGTNFDFSGIARFARGVVTGVGAAFTSAIEGEFGFDTTYNDFEYFAGSAARVVSPVEYGKFNISTTTTWTGTTTAYKIGPAPRNITMTKWWCKTDAGFLAVQFSDGTNRTNYVVASSTVGTTTLSTNNTWVQGEDMVLEIGTTTTASTKNIGCTYAYTFADS